MKAKDTQTIWREFVDRHSRCSQCTNEGLLDIRALPLFAKRPPRSFEILFILEAPNRDDTYNPNKKYITVGPDTDPTGSFFYDLFINELRFSLDDLFITNSVLCLPVNDGPLSSQRNNCLPILRQMIEDFVLLSDFLGDKPMGNFAIMPSLRGRNRLQGQKLKGNRDVSLPHPDVALHLESPGRRRLRDGE